jgi:hypothetical protein
MSQWALYQGDDIVEVFDDVKLAHKFCEDLKKASIKLYRFDMQTFSYCVRKIAQIGRAHNILEAARVDILELKKDGEIDDEDEDDDD